jgi:cytochrome bd-type quinol oxidase subunit 2
MDKMNEWPKWQRWGVWLSSWVLYLGGLAVLLSFESWVMRGLALLVLCVGLVLLTYSSKAVLNERMRKVDRWYVRVLLPTFVVYMVLMLYVWPMYSRIEVPWLKVIVVLLPLLPLAVVVWAMMRYMAHCDELERRQQLDAIGIAAAVVSLVSFALGLLAATKLIAVNGALVLLLIFPALCIVYGLACAWSKWRWRGR